MSYSSARLVLPGSREEKPISAQEEADIRNQRAIERYKQEEDILSAKRKGESLATKESKVAADAKASEIKAQLDALVAGQPNAQAAAPVPSKGWFGSK